MTKISPEQRARNVFIREHLPMFESSWSGSTLAHHVIVATLRQNDPEFQAMLEDSLKGLRAVRFHMPDDPTADIQEFLDLTVMNASILDRSVTLVYDDTPTEYVLRPAHLKAPGIDVIHRFIVPSHLEV